MKAIFGLSVKTTIGALAIIVMSLATVSCGGGGGGGGSSNDTGNGSGDNSGGDNSGGDNSGGDNSGGDNSGGDNSGGDNTAQCSFSDTETPYTLTDPLNNGSGNDLTQSQYSELIANLADIAYAGYSNLAVSTTDLQSKVQDYCATATSRADQTKRTAAQDSFKQAMDITQQALLYAYKTQEPGQGLDPALRAEHDIKAFYSWPLVNRCSIDKRIATDDANPGSSEFRKGLDAIEHLLFAAEDAGSSCNYDDLTAFEKSQYDEFAALGSDEKVLRRCNYMQNVMTEAVDVANGIKAAWDPADADGAFLTAMKNTSNTIDTLNKVTDAMYYIEDVVKDDKLAQPMGSGRSNTIPTCGEGNKCPEDVESPSAKISIDNMISNMQSFQELYYGGTPADKAANLGFDDWLITKGEVELADRTTSQIEAVINGLNSIKTNHGSLYNAVDNCEQEVETFFDTTYQPFARGFRDYFLPRLGLQRPQASQADTD